MVAVNNYRQSGGGGFPHIATAPVVYNAQVAIREAIVAYASAAGTIDPRRLPRRELAAHAQRHSGVLTRTRLTGRTTPPLAERRRGAVVCSPRPLVGRIRDARRYQDGRCVLFISDGTGATEVRGWSR